MGRKKNISSLPKLMQRNYFDVSFFSAISFIQYLIQIGAVPKLTRVQIVEHWREFNNVEFDDLTDDKAICKIRQMRKEKIEVNKFVNDEMQQ